MMQALVFALGNLATLKRTWQRASGLEPSFRHATTPNKP